MRHNSTGDLYPFTLANVNNEPSSFSLHDVSSSTCHNRFVHPGNSVFNLLRTSFPNSGVKFDYSCNACSLGKHCRLPFSPSQTFTFALFDIIHADLWTSPVASKLGHKYYLVLLDDFSHFTWTYPLQSKSQVFSTYQQFHTFIQTQFHKTIKNLQCDNGREFNNYMFTQFFIKTGTQFWFTCPYTSPQNGKVERIIRIINNMIRTNLLQAFLPPSFWHHALSVATYLTNILRSTAIKNKTPTEILYLRKPTYSHLRTFGCLFILIFPLLHQTN